MLASSRHLADTLENVPVLVFPCLLGRPAPTTSDMETAGFHGSILPALWTFMLALRSRGLAVARITLHLAREQEVATLLGRPDTVTQVGDGPGGPHHRR